MITPILVGALVAGLFLCLSISAPASDRTRDRSAARRRKYVEANPTHVNTADILDLMRREGVPADQARFITEKAALSGIKPFTMWLWLRQFDAEALGIVVAADLTHRQLLTHISNGTVPDLEELKVFASLNGLELSGPKVESRRKTAVPQPALKVPVRRPMPPIFEPGLRPRTASSAVPMDDRSELPTLGDVRNDQDGGLAA